MEHIIKIENIKFSYGKKIIFDNFSVNIKMNEKIVFKAPSGFGKSTMLKIIAGFLIPEKGNIIFNNSKITDKNILDYRKEFCMMPQNVSSVNNGTVLNTILKPFEFEANKNSIPNYEKIIKTLSILNLNEKILKQKFSDLSGGEQQRIALVICNLLDRKIILLDEPTSALDDVSMENIVKLFFNEDKTIISASHDKDYINYFDRVIDLERNKYGTN